ncbi:low temperature requirement protein A [Deinococcus sp. Arct2-2]|nr:low temperature requirement protein A [Deinococcus sp. Arct2-2]
MYLSFVYGYVHLPVFAGIVAASIGLELFFEEVGQAHVSAEARLLLCGGLALFLSAVSVSCSGPRRRAYPPACWWAAGQGLLIALGTFGGSAGAAGLALGVTVVVGLLLIAEYRRPGSTGLDPAFPR